MIRRRSKSRSDFIFEISNVGGSFHDPKWEINDAEIIQLWKKADPILGIRRFNYDDCQIEIDTSLLPIVRRFRHTYGVMQDLKGMRFAIARKKANNKAFLNFRNGPVKVKCTVSISATSKAKLPHAQPILECYLYDVFLIMNLCAPGSANFYRAILKESKATRRHDPSEFLLSGSSFELALVDGSSGKWLAPKLLPPEKVVAWYFDVRTACSQMPQNRMEKVLFALWHIAADGLSPATIIWIFYALETLFDTRPGENLRMLIQRIRLLLSPDEKAASVLNKKMRTMYDLRSAFVHGGLEVAHPMHNEILDRSVDRDYERLMGIVDFGFSVLLASVQELISRGLRESHFEEVLREVFTGDRPPANLKDAH